ncbi:MAG: cytochrome ubiquinol oxidase subunit I [Armatimonadetes bacterium]|nr:cytochrome ubiquinol oxidase subunit I [Armatimonadota bacterium]
MDSLTAARAQMAFSLGFHIIFAALGIGLPLLMVIAEGLWLRTRRPEYLALARKWSKATAVLFAIGAVSGTVLSFELGLLWPHFMEIAGGVFGAAFALEGYAFFLEAIFLGLYLYGWERLRPRVHWLCGVAVAIAGAISGILVLSANAWMQQPVGFAMQGDRVVSVDPVRALFNPAWAVMTTHSTLSVYIASAFGVAAVYAWGYLRGRRDAYQRAALRTALVIGAVAALLQPISGDFNARFVSRFQPTKLAAMEAQFRTQRRAPLRIGGWPDLRTGRVYYAIEIPGGLSFLAYHDPNAVVQGLEEFPRDLWPPVPIVHVAFQLMVGIGLYLVVVAALYWIMAWRRVDPLPRWLLRLLVAAGPLAFLAVQAGWTVTEVGRQPWIIRDVLLTREAVTPVPGVQVTLGGVLAVYAALSATLTWFLLRLVRSPQVPEFPIAPKAFGGGDRAEAGPCDLKS